MIKTGNERKPTMTKKSNSFFCSFSALFTLLSALFDTQKKEEEEEAAADDDDLLLLPLLCVSGGGLFFSCAVFCFVVSISVPLKSLSPAIDVDQNIGLNYTLNLLDLQTSITRSILTKSITKLVPYLTK